MSLISSAAVYAVATEEPTGTAQPVRLPVPDAAAVAAAREMIDEAYAEELRRAKEHPLKLVPTLSSAASATDDPARRYALMRQAEQLAVAAGDHGLAMRLVIRRGEAFQVDTTAELLTTLKQLAAGRNAETPRLVPLALGLARDAVAAERFSLALAAVAEAKDIAQGVDRRERMAASERRRSSRGTAREEQRLAPAMLAEVERVRAAVIARQKAYEKYVQAQALLEADSGSEAGHRGIGMYLCFDAEDWERGLPHLARAAAGGMSAAAAAELEHATHPDPDASGTFRIAGLWWQVADLDGLSTQQVSAIRNHAGTLYDSIASRLSDPLDKAIAERRLQDGRRTPLSDTPHGGRQSRPKFDCRATGH